MNNVHNLDVSMFTCGSTFTLNATTFRHLLDPPCEDHVYTHETNEPDFTRGKKSSGVAMKYIRER